MTPRFLQVLPLVAFSTLALLAACSGGGCGSNCNVPAIHPATPSPSPTPSPTPSPSPTPTIAPLSCSQSTTSPNAIVLGTALAPFAVLAGSTVTNAGSPTLVTFATGAVTGSTNDDLIGVSPGTAETGFYPGGGTDTDGPNAIYALTPPGLNTNTAVPLAAQNALTTAYNTAAGKTATATVAGDLGGQTLSPGVYKSTSTLLIASGNLTLDGGGNTQSIFIFQIGSGLTTNLNGTVGGNVILTNGASACNIYWQVGSSAVLGGATFFGNVLAFSSITINATTFTGRALAGGASLGTGAVSIPIITGSTITNPGGQ